MMRLISSVHGSSISELWLQSVFLCYPAMCGSVDQTHILCSRLGTIQRETGWWNPTTSISVPRSFCENKDWLISVKHMIHSLYSRPAPFNRFASDHLDTWRGPSHTDPETGQQPSGNHWSLWKKEYSAAAGHWRTLLALVSRFAVEEWETTRLQTKSCPFCWSSKTQLLLWRWMFSICSTFLKFYCSTEHANCGWPWQPASSQSNHKVCGVAKSLQLISPSNNWPAGPGVQISLATGGCWGSSAGLWAWNLGQNFYWGIL